MKKINRFPFALIFSALIFTSGVCLADESNIFSISVEPDALIIIDLSGSMRWNTVGTWEIDPDPNSHYSKQVMYTKANGSCTSSSNAFYATSRTVGSTNYTKKCYIDLADYPTDGIWTNNLSCDNSLAYYRSNTSPHNVECSSVAIAKRAIMNILDADQNGQVLDNPPNRDEDVLGVRIGYMTYFGCYAPFNDACITIRKEIGTPYSQIWSSVSGESTDASTPIVGALGKAKLYLDGHKAADSAGACRQKFVILITDGADNFSCNGVGDDQAPDQYKRRKATAAKAKELADAGYKVFVVGFGAGMSSELSNTLNWAAYYGGTDNPLSAKSGNTSAITPSTDPCEENTSNDPGNQALSGYAFIATSANDLNESLKSAFRTIQESRYSFSAASVPANRISGENFLYESSFKPKQGDPFWEGHLKKYEIDAYGNTGSQVWDAGDLLKAKNASDRNIFTLIGGSSKNFDTSWSSRKDYLGAATDTAADNIVGYIRGDSAKNPDNWKLGDMFHSNPVTVGSPSYFYIDALSPDAFASFRVSKKDRERITLLGSNDGQFRAFSAGDGSEKWSFIPPNLLPKLRFLSHTNHTQSLPSHTYFVDGPVTVADVWWKGDGTIDEDGKNKVAGDWKTLLVFSEGRGVRESTNATANYLWSASSHCDSNTANFNKIYTAGYPYYCGYWAFDVTDTSATTPTFKWVLQPNATQAPYLAEPWSKMAIGRVKKNGYEKWVGFIGGGYNADPNHDPDGGKGFFVVDLSNGNILWSYTKGNDANMTYSIPASPAIVDTDNDGFVDTAYIGDLGGNVWRFKFCTGADGSACGTSNWSGGRFFQSSTATPIYTTPSVARASGSLWVFWGTGDKEKPTLTNTADSFFAVKDDNRAGTYTTGNLQPIDGGIFSGGSYQGWYITFPSGEKVLADSSVFGGMIAWTGYVPYTGTDECKRVGTAKLFAVAMLPVKIGTVTYQVGAGLFAFSSGMEKGTRAIELGTGISQLPVFSQKPGGTGATDAYITTSGGVKDGVAQDSFIVTSARMEDSPFKRRLQDTAPSAQVIHWRDQRVQ